MVHWHCSQCNRTWRYPLTRCPYCFASLKKRIASQHTTEQTLNVSIASKYHPTTPYTISIFKDEYGQQWLEKKLPFDPQANKQTNTRTNKVTLEKVTYDLGFTIEKIWHNLKLNIIEQSSVLLVPQLSEKHYPFHGHSTNPLLVEALVDFLKQHVYKVKLSLGFFDYGDKEKKVLEKNGLKAIVEKHQLSCINLQTTQPTPVTWVIALPPLVYNKNNAVCQPAVHYQQTLIKNSVSFTSILFIADGTVGQLHNQAAWWNILIAGYNPVSIDQVFSLTLGLRKTLPRDLVVVGRNPHLFHLAV